MPSISEHPLVSIVIPCFNASSWIAEALQSTLDQKYDRIEVIVVDDGSTDDSLSIIESFPGEIRILKCPHRGGSAARNSGLQIATGDFVKFLDADDLLTPNCILEQVCQISQLTEEEIVFGDVGKLTPSGKFSGSAGSIKNFAQYESSLEYLLRNIITTSAVLHRTPLLKKVAGFDEELRKGQEYDLHIRLALSGVTFVYRPCLTYLIREHTSPNRITIAQSLGRNPESSIIFMRKAMDMIMAFYDGHPPQKVRDALFDKWWLLARRLMWNGNDIDAEKCFALARELSSTRIGKGKFPYAFLVSLFGPVRAERMLQELKSVIKLKR